MILDTDKQNCRNCIGNCFKVIKNGTPETRVCSEWTPYQFSEEFKEDFMKHVGKSVYDLETAFKEYLKEHNCETCWKHCAAWLHIEAEKESTTTCIRWTPKRCEHTYASVNVPGMDIIVFECTKCGKEITYRKV